MQARQGICEFFTGGVLAVRWNVKNLKITKYCAVNKVYFINQLA